MASEQKTSADLRETLFTAIHHVNCGELDAASAKAIAGLAGRIIESAKLDIAAAELRSRGGEVRPVMLVAERNPSGHNSQRGLTHGSETDQGTEAA